MNVRKLQLKDAPHMLEWMHDENVVKDLQANFMSKTIEDCEKFITYSLLDNNNLHYAITDDEDTYMGTVSLKNINEETAEFAITVRKSAMGKGYSLYGMKKIIDKGLNELGLKKIYWCVNPVNKRAVRFYDKNGFEKTNILKDTLIKIIRMINNYTENQIENYIWYIVM